MSPLPSAYRFFRLGRVRQAPGVHDAADMGTAFGLDMAQPCPGFDEMPEPPPALPAPAAMPPRGWLARWQARKR